MFNCSHNKCQMMRIQNQSYLQLSGEDHWLHRIIQSKVQTTVDNDSNTGNVETTVKSSNTIRFECLSVDIDQAIELPLSSLLGSLSIISKTGSGIIQRVNKEQRRSTSSTTRCQVARKPLPVAITVFLEVEQPLEVVFERKVQGL